MCAGELAKEDRSQREQRRDAKGEGGVTLGAPVVDQTDFLGHGEGDQVRETNEAENDGKERQLWALRVKAPLGGGLEITSSQCPCSVFYRVESSEGRLVPFPCSRPGPIRAPGRRSCAGS